jgi:hypothetical protein
MPNFTNSKRIHARPIRRHRFIPKTVPGLDGFYLASMWTNAPGGLSGAAEVGRGVVQLLCARDKQRFVTTTHPE